jgi:hypothetical protein
LTNGYELAKLMQEIDVKYKSGKKMSGYHKYEKDITKKTKPVSSHQRYRFCVICPV